MEGKETGWKGGWVDGSMRERVKSLISNVVHWFTSAKWTRKGEMAVI